MKKTILVYDNQLGYYNLLKENFKHDYKLVLFNKDYKLYSVGEDATVFFLHDDIELIDLIKIYRPEVPLVIGCSQPGAHCLSGKKNIYDLSLMQTKDEILRQLGDLLHTIIEIKEKAL
jgi:hypothetical protein